MSTAADFITCPAQSPEEKFNTYAELVAELPESNQPCELWDGQLLPRSSFPDSK